MSTTDVTTKIRDVVRRYENAYLELQRQFWCDLAASTDTAAEELVDNVRRNTRDLRDRYLRERAEVVQEPISNSKKTLKSVGVMLQEGELHLAVLWLVSALLKERDRRLAALSEGYDYPSSGEASISVLAGANCSKNYRAIMNSIAVGADDDASAAHIAGLLEPYVAQRILPRQVGVKWGRTYDGQLVCTISIPV